MLTPCVKPVTAGKKIAKTAQKPAPPRGRDQLVAEQLAVEVRNGADVEGQQGRNQHDHDDELELARNVGTQPGQTRTAPARRAVAMTCRRPAAFESAEAGDRLPEADRVERIETDWARNSTMPMAPPNSTPSVREIR